MDLFVAQLHMKNMAWRCVTMLQVGRDMSLLTLHSEERFVDMDTRIDVDKSKNKSEFVNITKKNHAKYLVYF